MRIGIFLYSIPIGNIGGVQQYTERLVLGLSKYSNYQIILFCSSENYPHYKKFINEKKVKIIVLKEKNNFFKPKHLNAIFKETFLFFQKIKLNNFYFRLIKILYKSKLTNFLFSWGDFKIWIEKNADIIHFPYPYLNRYDLDIPTIITTHDIQHRILPENFSTKSIKQRDKYYISSAQICTKIIVSFSHVKKDIIKFYNILENKISICRFGHEINENYINKLKTVSLETINKLGIPNEYIIYPAAPSKHKNHIILIEALDILKKKYNLNINLVITGNKYASDYYLEIEKKLKERALTTQVYFTGYLKNDDLYSLILKSQAVVVPTLYEAGSAPVDDALMLNTPVICSNVTALPEQIGDSRFLFNPKDPDEIAYKINKIINDETFRRANIDNCQIQKQNLNWKKNITCFLNTYQSAIDVYYQKV